jgi:hypothetical protein
MASHITINGHTYSSVEQMPADVRRQYEAAVRLLSKNVGAVGHVSDGDVNISTTGSDAAHHTLRVSASRIVVNGKEYGCWEEVPPEVRTVFQSAGADPQMPFAAGTKQVAGATQIAEGFQLMSVRRMLQLGAIWLAKVVAYAAIAGLLFQAAITAGLFGPMSWANWGPGETAEGIQMPDGRYAIRLYHFGRIQIYSSNLQFLYGWNTRTLGGDALRLSADGNLILYMPSHPRVKNSGWDRKIFDINGTLLLRDANGYNPDNPNLPGRGGELVHIPDGSPWWWTYPFRGVFCAFGTLFGDIFMAIVLSFVLFTREEREAYRSKKARGFLRSNLAQTTQWSVKFTR